MPISRLPELVRTERRVRREQGTQASDEVGLLQLAGADIDADRDVEPDGLPGFELPQRAFNHPFADVDRQRMLFDDRQEDAGW